jgi:hypothetical protein
MRRFLPIVPFAIAIVAGCAGNPPVPPESSDDACYLRGPDVPSRGGSLKAVRSEHLHGLEEQTLVNVDCQGRIARSGLAESYSGSGRRWIITLRDSVRPVNARDVARSWTEASAHGAGVDSVRALDDRRLEVFLERPALSTLASPEFAIAVPSDAVAVFIAESVPAWTMIGQTDPRDMLASVDLMVTGDPAIADYAAGLGMTAAAMPYDRTFVLLVPGRTAAATLVPAATVDLAAAVRTASARPAATPAWWWNELDGCGELSSWPGRMISAASTDSDAQRVYYEAGDDVARDLAERIVALAAMDTAQSPTACSVMRALAPKPGTVVRAAGLASDELGRRMERGDGLAFVTSIRNPVPDSCGSARDLLRRVPWLRVGNGTIGQAVIPMIDTRNYVILANRNVQITWDIYGDVRILPPAGQP